MTGYVDEFGRALVTLNIRQDAQAGPRDLLAWIDTGFNGELVLPKTVIDAEKLKQTGGIEATLADGNVVTLETFSCCVDWFGTTRTVEVLANDGAFPLIGVGLLIGRRLVVDYELLAVTIE